MSGLKADNRNSLANLAKGLRKLGQGMAHAVAKRSAPAITAEAKKTFNAGTDPYGTPWEPGTNGQSVDLKESGRLYAAVEYKAIGAYLRVALNQSYAKYQLGKRLVFPRQYAELPASYDAALKSAAEETFAAQWRAIQEGR